VCKGACSRFPQVHRIRTDDTLYTEQELANCLEKIEVMNYHQEVEHKGIKFWCYNAGHVLGAGVGFEQDVTCAQRSHAHAAMFMVEIDGTRLLYTGDYSRQVCCSTRLLAKYHLRTQPDRHLMAAEVPAMSPDVLIVESTYGKQVMCAHASPVLL
jgi:cleavage and polyadenylation specificity factor subunit 3